MAVEGEVCFSPPGAWQGMNWLMYFSWVAGPALEIALLACMVHRKLHPVFPRFFSYIIFQALKSGILFLTYRYYEHGYFEAYWTGNAISVILAVAVMDEILQHIFEEYGGAQNLGSVIFRWACGLLLLLAIVTAFTNQQGSADRVVAVVLTFDRSVRVMQCGLFCLLMILCRLLKNCWRQQVFGIALGFGVFASIEVILVSVAMRYGSPAAPTISLVKSAAYNAVTILWIGYLAQQAHSIPAVEMAPRLDLALADPAASTDGFISMVERAVEEVISRNPWPRPSTNGPHVVGREPGPGENN
jgi:hypothetical protein